MCKCEFTNNINGITNIFMSHKKKTEEQDTTYSEKFFSIQ